MILTEGITDPGGFTSALRGLRDATSYLVFRDTAGVTVHSDLSSVDAHLFPSQYLRRKLGEHFHMDHSWDWRQYDHQEPYLLESLQHFRGLHN